MMTNSPKPARRGAGTRVIALVALLLLLGSMGGFLYTKKPFDRTSPSEHPRRVIPNTDLNPYGADFFLAQEVEEWKIRKTLEMAKAAGIGWVKQEFSWEEIEPTKGQFVDERTHRPTWDKYDRIVSLCEEYGLQIIARLDRPPEWAKTGLSGYEGPPQNFSDYGDFVSAFVSHYGSRIRYIQIWNEPNLWYEWGGKTPDAREYTELLKIGYQRAKEANPNVYVLAAPLAQTLGEERAPSELDFLSQMYQAGAKDYFDILLANGFGFEYPPDDPPDPNRLNLSRVLLLRDIMVKNDDAGKPVWFSEFGWNASPADMPPEQLLWRRVTEEQQADYTMRALQLVRQWDWVGVVCLWYFRQVGDIPPDRSDYYFRLVDVDFTPRLLYQRLKQATADLGIAGLGYFEETNPAVATAGSWRSFIEPQASGGSYLVSGVPGSTLAFTFRGNILEAVVPQDADMGSFIVTVDGRPANALPRDKQGRAVLDLRSDSPRWQEWVTVARNLGSGVHKAEFVTVDQGGRQAIDALIVQENEQPRWPAQAALVASGVGFLATAALLGREVWRLRRPPSRRF
jgi:hypothetical protein